VRSDETASRNAVRPRDKELLDLVAAIRKTAVERLQLGTPVVQTDRLRTADLDDHSWGHQRVERRCVLFVDRAVEALNQFPDCIV
jgi:hypothetical protein